jgi:hypothetical protein
MQSSQKGSKLVPAGTLDKFEKGGRGPEGGPERGGENKYNHDILIGSKI